MPTAAKDQNKKHCDSPPNLWRLLCWSLVLTGGAFTVTLASGAFTLTRNAGEPVRFSKHLLANEHRYTFGIATVDIDGDGDLDLTYPDIYSAGGQGESNLYWLENNGRGIFQRHVIHKGQLGWMERHATGDINGDGRPDVAMVDNRWGRLFWFANPDRPADGHWKQHVITTKCPGAYDVVLSDLDGDGDLDAASSGFTSGQINWYENPGKQGLDGEWTHHMIDKEMKEDSRTIDVGDFNNDGKTDLLATTMGRRNRSAEEKNHGSQVVWYENLGKTPSGRWKKHVIDNTSRGPCHGHPADMDDDGDLDVVMAHGMLTTIDPKVERHEVVWYENVRDPKAGRLWKRHRISRLPFAFEAIAKDLDSDGDVDVIATAWANTPRLYGQPVTTPGGDRVVWFENRGPDQWVVHSLQDKFHGANQVITADLNGDKRPDIVASCDGAWVNGKQGAKSEIRWWRNEGVPAPAKELSFVPKGETEPEPYFVEKPASIEPGTRQPLIINLHGDGDRVVPVVYSRQFVKAVKAKGYKVVYKEVPGGRHAMSLMHGFEDKFLDFFDAADTAHSQKPQVD